MQQLIYVSLAIALALFTYTCLPVKHKFKKSALRLGVLFYTVFIVVSLVYAMITADAKDIEVNQVTISLSEQEVGKKELNAEEKPLIITWEKDIDQVQVRKAFNLKLTIENNLGQDIRYLDLSFEDKPLTEMFMVSKVTPEVNIRENLIGIGKVEVGTKKEFDFELVPFQEGLYVSEIIPLNDYEEIIADTELTSELEIKIEGNN